MFSLTAESLAEEIRYCEMVANKHLTKIKLLEEAYMSRNFRDDVNPAPMPENQVFGWVAHMMTELAFAAPSARVQATWEVVHGEVAEFMEIALGKWCESEDVQEQFELWVRDALLGYGVMKIGMEGGQDNIDDGRQGYGPALKPFAVRVPRDQFGMDPKCESYKDARIAYHTYWKDIEDLESSRGADPAAVEKIKGAYEEQQKRKNSAIPTVQTADRRQVKCCDIWIPEHQKVCTLAWSGDEPQPMFLRPPTDWWGPKCGPFIVLGFYTVPGDPYPMSPIQPVFDEIQECNSHVVETAREAATGKKGVLVTKGNKSIAEAIQNAANNFVWEIDGSPSDAVQIEVGGVSDQRLKHTEIVRQRVERRLGMGSEQQGKAQAGAGGTPTATAVVTAQNAIDTVKEWLRNQVLAGAVDVLKGVGWYMFNDENFSMKVTRPVQQVDPMTGMMTEVQEAGTLYGGTQDPFGGLGPMDNTSMAGMGAQPMGATGTLPMGPDPMMGGMDPFGQPAFDPMADVYRQVEEQADLDWEEDFRVTVEPNSMSRQDDMVIQSRAIQTFGLVGQMLPLMIQFPQVGWKELWDMFGESFNQRDFYDITFGKLMGSMGMGMSGMMPGQQPGMTNPNLPQPGGMGMQATPAIGGPAQAPQSGMMSPIG